MAPTRDTCHQMVVLGSCFGLNFLALSMYTCFPVLLVEFTEIFGGTQASMGLIGSVMAGVWYGSCIFIGVFSQRYGAKIVTIVTSLSGVVGFLISSQMPDSRALYITYGLLVGISVSGSLIPATAEIQYNFVKRAFPSGVASAGGSMATLVVPPFYRLLISQYSWRGAMLIHSAILLHGVILATRLSGPRPPKEKKVEENKNLTEIELNAGTDETSPVEDACNVPAETYSKDSKQRKTSQRPSFLRGLCNAKLFHYRNFWLFGIIGNMCMVFGSATFYQASVARGVKKGLTKMEASLLISSIGLFSCIGRVALSALGNLDCTNRTIEIAVVTIIGGIASCASCVSGDFYFSAATAACYGLCFGAYMGLWPTVMVDLLELDVISAALGWSMSTGGVAALTAMPLAGWLYDVTSNYDIGFYVAGSLQTMGGLCILSIPFLPARRKRKPINSVQLHCATEMKEYEKNTAQA